MRELRLYETDFPDARSVHDYLAEHLGFPSYYGANLAALQDCLEDLEDPVSIVVERVDEDHWDERPWFGRICDVLIRAAREGDVLHLSIRR